MDISVEKLLTSRDNLQLTTKGRRTGKPHSVIVSYVYEDGYVYLLAGVPRDWHKNIKKNPDLTLPRLKSWAFCLTFCKGH